MPDARISVALTAHAITAGSFPSVTTYPASFERYLTAGTTGQTISNVYAVEGVVGSGSTSLPVAATLAKIKVWYVENTGTVTGATSSVTLAGSPVDATVPRGQCLLATNDYTGWTAANVTVSGTAGATYKIIALGN